MDATETTNLAVMVYGTTLGWASPVLVMINRGEPFHLTTREISLVVSILFISNILSPVPSGKLMDLFGRKRTMIAATVVLVLSSSMLIVFENRNVMYAARFLAGIHCGAVVVIAPIYSGEIAEPNIRGSLTTIGSLMLMVGIFVEYLVGTYVSYNTLNIINVSISVAYICLLLFIPESPYWYMMKNKKKEATEALSWLRFKTADEVQEELSSIEQNVTEQMKNSTSPAELLATRGNRRAITSLVVICFFNRLSGFTSLMSFASTSLPDLGWASPKDCALLFGAVSAVAALFAVILIDRFNRRHLLMASTFGCGVAMSFTAFWYYLDIDAYIKQLKWIPVLMVLIFGAIFNVGFGPLPMIFQGEYFPSNVKAYSSATASILYAGSSFVSSIIWNDIDESIGLYFNFVIFAAGCFIATAYTAFYLIETKGKSLPEIQELLNKP